MPIINVFFYKCAHSGFFIPNGLPQNIAEIFLSALSYPNGNFASLKLQQEAGYSFSSRLRLTNILKYSKIPYKEKDILCEPITKDTENWFEIVLPFNNPLKNELQIQSILNSIPAPVLKKIHNENVKVIISLLTEKSHKILQEKKLAIIFNWFKTNKISPQNRYLLSGDLEIKKYWNVFYTNLSPIQKKEFNWTVVPLNYFEIVEPQLLSLYQYTPNTPSLLNPIQTREKIFISLNRKTKDIRIYFIAEFARRNILKVFNYSLGICAPQNSHTQDISKRLNQVAKKYFPKKLSETARLNRFKSFMKIEESYPIFLDTDAETLAQNTRLAPKQVIENTYFHFVTETKTLFSTSTEPMLFITERTYKAILWLQPFIILGNPFTLKYLRSLGYQTFPEIFDESYDEILDDAERLEFIINEIQRIASLPILEVHRLYFSVSEKLKHNYELLFNRNKSAWIEDICLAAKTNS